MKIPLSLSKIVPAILLAPFLAACGGSAGSADGPRGSLVDPDILPAVISTDPPENSIGPYVASDFLGSEIIVRFNKMMDLPSLRAACRFVDVRENRSIPIDISSITGDVVYIRPRGPFRAGIGRVYRLMVDSAARDANGNRLVPSFSSTYKPEPKFRVRSVVPTNGALGVSPLAVPRIALTLTFNSEVDSSILPHVGIVPSISGTWILLDSTAITHPLYNLIEPDTSYTVSVDTSAHDRYGNPLPEKFVCTFATSPFAIAGSLPADGSSEVPTSSTITLIPTASIDTATVGQSFSIEPHVAGSFLLDTDQIVYVPAPALQPSTTYTVRIGTTLASEGGKHPPSQFVFAFTTAR